MVITHRFWREFLGADPNVLGRSLTLNGHRYSVIGVMPANFALPEDETDIFVSLWVAYPEAAPFRGVHFMQTYWRLNPGVTLEQAQADLSGIAGRLAKQYPDTEGKRQKTLVPLHQFLVGDIRPALLVLFGAVGLVFLIACANFAGLLTARAIARRQEFVLRASLGAGRLRLVTQAVTESVVLSLLGGALGLALAKWGTSLLVSLEPAALDHFRGIQMDARLFAFIFTISLLTGIVFGLIPALGATSGNAADSLKESGRGNTAGKFSHAFRNVLVAAEFALALILLVSAGLMIKGFARLQSVNPGFNPSDLMTMHLQLPITRYDKIPQQTAFRRELLTRLNGLPGVQAAMVTDLPFGGNFLDHRFAIDGRPPVPVGNEPSVQTLSVMGDYFGVMQIPILAGRGLTDMDRENQPLVAVVSEELVRRFFPNENPLGARIDFARTNEPHQWMTIVGVARDVKHGTLNEPPEADLVRALRSVRRVVAPLDEPRRAPARPRPIFRTHPRSETTSLGNRQPDPRQRNSLDGRLDERLARAPTLQHAFARIIRWTRDAARRRRHLRHDGLSRQPAHQRNRHPHGARRATSRRLETRPRRRSEASVRRNRRRHRSALQQ